MEIVDTTVNPIAITKDFFMYNSPFRYNVVNLIMFCKQKRVSTEHSFKNLITKYSLYTSFTSRSTIFLTYKVSPG